MVSLRIIIYSGMLGLPLMLMSFYLGQNVLMIVDVLTLVFLRIWGLIASVVFTSWVCNLTRKHHHVDLYCGAGGLLWAVFPKRCFGYGM